MDVNPRRTGCPSNACAIANACSYPTACRAQHANEVENLKLRGSSARKPPLGIVPMHALVGASRVLEDSSVKYAPGNFMAQPVADACEAYDSAQLRHRLQCTPLSGLVTPESYAALDEDSGLPHIDHMIAGLLILRTLMIRDGMLPADPGIGKRKAASVAEPEPSWSPPMVTARDNGDGTYTVVASEIYDMKTGTLVQRNAQGCAEVVERTRLHLDTSDPATRATYAAVLRARDEVAEWPAWKRGEIDPDRERMERAEREAAERAAWLKPARAPMTGHHDPDARKAHSKEQR